MSEMGGSGARVWRWLVVVLSVVTVLAACSGPVEVKPDITLRADQTSLSGPGNVTLSVDVVKGRVDSVLFKANKGAAIAPVTVPNKDGDFVATVTVQETTVFTAEAKGPGGTTTTPADKAVTVTVTTPLEQPKAPSSSTALKGFETINLTVGTPTGLTVVASTIPGVTGNIVGNVQAETKNTSKGKVTIQAGTGKLEFLYTPNAGATGADSFEYTVTNPGGTAKGKIDISLAALSSADFQLADSLAEINDTSKATVFLTSDITCTRSKTENNNPCVRLDNNQSLIGLGSATVNGVTLANAGSSKPKIIANMAETRKSGTASCGTVDALIAANGGVFPAGEFDPRPNCTETKVVILRDNTTVEGIEITSSSNDESSTYFVAIYARGDRAVDSTENVLDGNIKIKNVTINRSNGKPIYIQYTFDATGVATPEYGNYNLEIDGLDLNDANDTLVVGNPRNLVFKNSTIELLQPKGNNAGPQPFGDNSGVQIANYVSGNITLDNVDVFMESTEYRIDFMPGGNNGTPIEVFSDSGFNASVSSTLTIKNSDVTYGPNGILAADVASFRAIADGATLTINSSESTNNKSVKGLTKIERDGGSVPGQIQVSP